MYHVLRRPSQKKIRLFTQLLLDSLAQKNLHHKLFPNIQAGCFKLPLLPNLFKSTQGACFTCNVIISLTFHPKITTKSFITHYYFTLALISITILFSCGNIQLSRGVCAPRVASHTFFIFSHQ